MKKLLAFFTLYLALTSAYAHPQDGNVISKDITNPYSIVSVEPTSINPTESWRSISDVSLTG
jgi:hypothetical protein